MAHDRFTTRFHRTTPVFSPGRLPSTVVGCGTGSPEEYADRRTLTASHGRLAELLQPGMTVLDVGCGNGAITAGIAARVGSDGRNEELVAGEDVFFRYASRWNDDPTAIPAGRYVVREGDYRFVFATAHGGGVTFNAEETAWVDDALRRCAPHPTVLVTHAPAPGVFAAAGNRSMQDSGFTRLLHHPHVAMHLSGHTHFDLDAVEHYVEDAHGVHHVHVPGIERTKVGPRHTPRFRIIQLRGAGDCTVHTYNLKSRRLEPEHMLRFSLM